LMEQQRSLYLTKGTPNGCHHHTTPMEASHESRLRLRVKYSATMTNFRSPPPPPPPHEKQYLGDLGCEHVVFKNDEKTVEEIAAMNPRGVMVSPGPGKPEDSGISLEAVRVLGPQFGVFGVCMGHQCIGQVFGGDVIRAPCGLMHGKASPVWHTEDSSTMLSGLPSPFQAARYHSLVISRENFPNDELEITAWTEDETIMAVKHRKFPKIQGVQFHPESIITESGLTIIANWVKLINEE
jgi:anthranilate synthase component 2